MKVFADRREAGQLLAMRLQRYAHSPTTIVLGIPRGGVPVAYEVAATLGLILDICVVRKLGVPGREELAMGALAPQGAYYLDYNLIDTLHIPENAIHEILRRERQELKRREQLYREGGRTFDFSRKTLILVDDGLATGCCMRAALNWLKPQKPASIVIAIPVGPADSASNLRTVADEVICLRKVPVGLFFAIGAWYKNFSQTSDEEVCSLLRKARAIAPTHRHS